MVYSVSLEFIQMCGIQPFRHSDVSEVPPGIAGLVSADQQQANACEALAMNPHQVTSGEWIQPIRRGRARLTRYALALLAI
jgi:hypothetical protein